MNKKGSFMNKRIIMILKYNGKGCEEAHVRGLTKNLVIMGVCIRKGIVGRIAGCSGASNTFSQAFKLLLQLLAQLLAFLLHAWRLHVQLIKLLSWDGRPISGWAAKSLRG